MFDERVFDEKSCIAIDDLFERNYRKFGQEKNALRIFFLVGFFASIS